MALCTIEWMGGVILFVWCLCVCAFSVFSVKIALNIPRDLGKYVNVDDLEGFGDLPPYVRRTYRNFVLWAHEVSLGGGLLGRHIYIVSCG